MAHWDMTEETTLETLRRTLASAIEYRGTSAKALARTAGLGETVVRDILQGMTRDVKLGTVEKLAQALNMSMPDLLPGVFGPNEISDHPPIRSADAGETVGIVQLDLSAAMGPGTLIEDFVESEVIAFDLAALRRITRTDSDRLRLITGIGTSHEPKFLSGDQFLIDLNDNRLTRIDGYYWITFDGAHALKRLRPIGNGMIRVISENPDFEPMDLKANAVRIEGRAIWFARGL